MALPSLRSSLLALALVVSALVVSALTAGSACAQDHTISDQAPATFGETPMGRVVHGLNPMNWKMPKVPTFQQVMPSKEDKTRITKKKNNLMTDMKQTASKSWNKTKDVLNPKRLLPTNLFAAKPEATQPQRDVKQVGFFESLLRPQPPQKTDSVNDFLKQKRPITQ